MDSLHIFDLPNVMLYEILEYLSYEDISKIRLVNRKFDQVCQQILNGGFNRAVRQHSIIMKRIKALLPRRESERRNHRLARHADILTSIETRISMLSMTYTKYMDINMCCFIPGKVLDEIFRILRLISQTQKPLRPHEVLQELRDISSMAIEHFDEKIATTFKTNRAYNIDSKRLTSNVSGTLCSWNSPSSSLSSSSCSNATIQSVSNFIQNNILDSVKQSQSQKSSPITGLPAEDSTLFRCLGEYVPQAEFLKEEKPKGVCCHEAFVAESKLKKLEILYKKGMGKLHKMKLKQMHQARRLQQSIASTAELKMQVVDLKKRLEDVDAKNREISASIKQLNIGESPNAVDANVNEECEAPVGSPVSTSHITAALSDSNKNTTLTPVIAMPHKRCQKYISTDPCDNAKKQKL